MKNCPNCGAQIADDSRFCTECGKECTQGNICPHCGVSVNDSDSFCQNCGKSLSGVDNNEPFNADAGSANALKKYLPYIIGAVVLFGFIGYCSSNDSKKGDETAVADTIAVDSLAEDSATVENLNSEQETLAKKEFLVKFYKEKSGREQKDEYAYIKKNVTANGLQNLKDLYDFECDNGDCLATWVFDYDEGSDIGNLISSIITPQDVNTFLIENKYEYAKYSVLLTVVEEDGVYKIDRIEQKESTFTPPVQNEAENLDWLQGHWVYEQGNYKGHFIIQGNTITQYSSMNPKHYDATFRIEGNELRAKLIDGMDLVVKIDFANHTIDYGDGNWMRKIN